MTEENLGRLRKNQTRSQVLPTQLLQYGIALLSVVLALATTLLLNSYLAPTPTPLFFVAVIVSVWCGGLGPGIFATVLSTLAINYFLLEPIFELSVPNLGTLVRLGVFVMVAILINSLNASQRAARQRAEASLQSLRNSEARFGCLAESNIIGMLVADLGGAILEANHNFLQMVGYTEEELRAGRLDWREITPPESLESSERAVKELLNAGACTPFEKEYIHKDGSRVSVLHGAVMTGESTVTGFVLDLSERKRLEAIQHEVLHRERILHAEVQAANTQLETVLSSLKDQFLVLDREWRYVYASDRVVDMVGKPREDLIGQCIWELFPDTVGTQFYAEVHRAAAEQQIVQFEYFYASWQQWFENRVYPSATGVSVLVTDITARKQTEEALRQSEARFQVLVSNMPGMVYRYAPNAGGTAIFTYVSSGSRELVELEPETILQDANSFLSLIHPDDLLPLQESVTIAVENSSVWCWEGRLITPSGKLKWVQGRSRPQQTEHGSAWDGLLFDITERKQAEAEREQLLAREKAARSEAETANRIKDEFLAVLSHELRSPLNPILGWSKLLQTRKLDEQQTQQALTTIERNAKLQTQLIEDLLDVSRILRGKLVLNMAPINLVNTIEAALETVRLAVEAKSIDLEFEVIEVIDEIEVVDEQEKERLRQWKDGTNPATSTLQVMGDAARLQQVIWNLLTNAVKFTPMGGRVVVRLEKAIAPHSPFPIPHSAQITVTDTGKGISPEFLPYVFDYFRQEDGTTTRKFGGLGLGLAIVRHITELHGGTVWVDSSGEGLGATFTVQLPLLGSREAGTKKQETQSNSLLHPSHSPLSGIRVLAVDDDADIRELIEFILQQAGAEVCVVGSAVEALQQIEIFSPKLLISDVGMPDCDGYMLMRQVRNLSLIGDMIPAIALTAYARDFDQQQALAAGFQMHIAKPIEPEKLVNAIITLLEEHRKAERQQDQEN